MSFEGIIVYGRRQIGKSELVKKAGQALLTYTFALTNPEITSESATVLKVSGIQLPKAELYKLLVL